MSTTLGADLLTSTTNSGREPWQEQLRRFSNVPANQVVQASEVIRGIAGSWAASYVMDSGVSDEIGTQEPRSPGPLQLKASRIGQPGFPEINFAPYNAFTNRFSDKGGSLIGHPISFSVVGPTAKNPNTTWNWRVTDNSAVPLTGDILDLDPVPGITIPQHYGFTIATLTQQFPGGLYLVVSQTGCEGTVYNAAGAAVTGGLGDGVPIALGVDPITPKDPTSKYEIFRITGISNSSITLDYNKRLATYFTIAGVSPIIVSITLITPAASRLVAIPCGGAKREETNFAIVPPARVLNHDEQYPYDIWSSAMPGGWVEDYPTVPLQPTGTGYEYRQKPNSPIRKPKGYFNGRVWGESEVVSYNSAGQYKIAQRNTASGQTEPVAGDVVHVHSVRVKGNAHLAISSEGFQANLTSLLGWFEVISYTPGAPDYMVVRRYEESNPLTGRSYLGSPESLMLEDWLAGDRIELDITVHDPVSAVWSTTYADIDKIEAARLTNIIDPRWTQRSAKQPSFMPGVQPDRANRAVFNTSTNSISARTAGYNSNPGSLMDLGFKPVLFRATTGLIETSGGGTVTTTIPDYDNPVEIDDVVLDTSKTNESQYVEVDYSNGLLRLSHPIKTGSPLYPTAGVFTAADNPRKEMVLFMSCVPYSTEEGQLGTGVRVSGGSPCKESVCGTAVGETPESTEYVDSFGERLTLPLDPQVLGTGPSPGSSINVAGEHLGEVPPTGTVEILWGVDGSGGPVYFQGVNSRTSTFGYKSVTISGGSTLLNDFYGGGIAGDTVTVDAAHPAVAVWRKEVVQPNDLTGKVGTEYQYDTTYGSSKRASTIRVSDSEVWCNNDGSVTVKPRNTAINRLFEDLYSSWLLSGGVVSDPDAVVLGFNNTDYAEAAIIMHGVRRVLPSGAISLPQNTVHYVYVHQDVDATPTCLEVLYTDTLPLPDPDDILLAKVDTNAGTLLSLDLRNPLQDLDRRVDLYVGKLGNDTGNWTSFQPHFKTLREAVNYANEIKTPEQGNLGPSIRIRVVGHTVEDDSLGAIEIKTDGLTIDGDTWYTGVGEGEFAIPEILWTTTTEKNASATVEFSGVGLGDTVVIGGITFTGAAAENIALQEYHASAGDNTAATSLLAVVNDVGNQALISAANGGVSATAAIGTAADIVKLTATVPGTDGYLTLSTSDAVHVLLTDGHANTVAYLAWGRPQNAIFDLKGHSGLNFRNLTFRTPYLRENIPYSSMPPTLYVFMNTSTAAYSNDVTIDNCKVVNYVTGLLTGISVTCENWSVTRNSCFISKYGFLFTSANNFYMLNSVISDNYINGRNSVATAGLYSSSPAAAFQDDPVLTNVKIVRNKIENCVYGFIATGEGLTIEENILSNIDQISIVASHERLDIRNNWLDHVHVSAPAIFAVRYGIYVLNGQTAAVGRATSKIEGNIVQFDTVAADATIGVGIYASNQVGANAAGDPVYVLNNCCQQYKAAAPPVFLKSDITLNLDNSVISGNVGSIVLITGTANKTTDNYTDTLVVTGTYNNISGNSAVSGISSGAASDHFLIANNFAGSTLGTSSDHGCIIGNHVGTDMSMLGVDTQVVGNFIGDDLSIGEDNNSIVGNKIVGDISASKANAVGLAISENVVGGNVSINCTGSSICSNVITGNLAVAQNTNDNNVINGNWIGGNMSFVTDAVAQKPTGQVVIGNHVVGSITRSAAQSPHGIFLANHVTQIWGGAPDSTGADVLAHNTDV
jgi:hypothetical protein